MRVRLRGCPYCEGKADDTARSSQVYPGVDAGRPQHICQGEILIPCQEIWLEGPLFLWYDFWMGMFWDRKTRTLYIGLLPMVIFIVGGID